MTMRLGFLSIVFASLVLYGCSAAESDRLNHDYPSPPSIKRMTEPGACQGGASLAAKSLPLPDFPRRAKRQGRQGWVVISLDVSADGSTRNVEVKRSVPRSIFDKATMKAVQNWQFEPPENSGLSKCLVFVSYRLGKVYIGR